MRGATAVEDIEAGVGAMFDAAEALDDDRARVSSSGFEQRASAAATIATRMKSRRVTRQ
jgi:hypothetical protein